MLKPAALAARAITRSLPRPQILKKNLLGRRRLHVQSQKSSLAVRFAITATTGIGGVVAYHYLNYGGLEVHAEAPPLSVEESKAKLSAQHVQVKSSLENPGVYAWGDNTGRVIAPNSKEKDIKTPRRLHFFDNVLLRDLQLSQNAAAAVNDKGDVLQWGTGYHPDAKVPELTLRGKNIERVALTNDKVIALSKDKTIYTFPISKKYQHDRKKPSESSWLPGMSSQSDIFYTTLKPQLGYFESIRDISAGRDHLLILTSNGRVFSAAASFKYPAKGQLGIRGLTWDTRPTNETYDKPHEVVGLNNIKQVAAGDYHSLALDKNGRVFSFGDNINGQLGFEYNMEADIYDEPKELELTNIYPKNSSVNVTKIAAGGTNSYFILDVSEPTEDPKKKRTTVDVLACGTGIHGTLGNGRWTHVQGTPTKIKSLSGLFEFDEKTNKLKPIRLRDLHAGSNHAVAIMDNATKTNASSSASDVNYGSDVLWWGNNEHYQLGTGKRNNANLPMYIQPLDHSTASAADAADAIGSSSRGGNTDGREESSLFTAKDQVHRFQITPEGKVNGRRKAAQTVVCGRGNTAVFMKCL